ncbi:NADH-quinone oxidoreductase domain protein [Mycobacterium ulcerans str. Harvey]|uniref:NADH-quinone oxidoreductase domain protein n=1 Tax=Mycobacterium ulcerans str. Harvey TaxID=1299332 RepID=A0ABN0RAZ4_MYCUL|nr:NADH-quinone oxidoreductase domain protein [Mycobacterium ulcerans str. Harvey]
MAAARGLQEARGCTGVLVGGRATWEDAYAYAKFARIALDSNDIDFGPGRTRPRRPTSWPHVSRDAGNRQLRRPGIRAGGVAGRVRAGRRVADRVLAAA